MSFFKDFQDDIAEENESVNSEIAKDAAVSDEPEETVNAELVSMLSKREGLEKKAEAPAPAPAAPVAPVAPVSPCAPCAPVAPVSPWIPCSPWSPLAANRVHFEPS